MPIYKRIKVDESSELLIWKVEEAEDDLSNGVELTPKSQARLNGMKSGMHRRAFLSIRHLLKNLGYSDFDLIYDDNGKPHLTDEKYISITHSFQFTGVIISRKKVGIDIEKQRSKIKIIAPKFTPLEEYNQLGEEDLIRTLTIVWGAKESLYKLYGKQGLLFLHDIYVFDFDFEAFTTTATVTCHKKKTDYLLHFFDLEDFICVYAIQP